MPKPQPWYASLNQPPRSPKDGRNRKPSPSIHRRAPDRTHTGVDPNDAADAFTYASWSTRTILPFDEPKPPAIPYAGIRAGELIGHRMWFVLEGHRLCSLAHRFIWEPNAVIEGDVDKPVEDYPFNLIAPRFGGVYSYFTAAQVQIELRSDDGYGVQFPAPCVMGFLMTPIIIHGIAWGTIKCWGEVIEHEHGYRAQYAKLASLDGAIGCVDLPALRSKYHV